ncbi:MAG TPA: ArsA-related P-loop ATPase [Terriglobales bacterium]|nr:ArsA-related P-loop ATPase [Terriglobales bacterium]
MERVLQKKLIVCVGPGGVGKTTTSTALAVAAANAGRRVAVITFDPSRRLKDTLGLQQFSHKPATVQIGKVAIDALALDTKRTFDALIERFAPNAETAERILSNRLYQELSNELSGSAEYMAMEKLHELYHSRLYDTVVVDTPPSTHARDLLAAPNRLTALLASRAVSILRAPASLISENTSAFGRLTLTTLLRALERWTGMQLLNDLAEFVSSFESMLAGFQQRAAEIDRELRSRNSAFVLVTTPEAEPVEATIAFQAELRADKFPVAGIIANRVIAFPAPRLHKLQQWDEPLRSHLLANQRALHALAVRDQRTLTELHEKTDVEVLALLPMSAAAPTSLPQIADLARRLAPRRH